MSEENKTGLRAIILKLASPCNLSCTYCYEYNSGDNSWRAKPKLISDSIMNMLYSRIEDHQRHVSKNLVTVILHGGEPLLIGFNRLEALLEEFRGRFEPEQVEIVLQTNGTLLTSKYVSLLKRYKVTVGVSIDGDESHNSRRVDRREMQTWDRTLRGINLLKDEAPEIFGGILAVMNLDENAADIVKALGQMKPPSIDFLQPFANHQSPTASSQAEQFGDWFIEAMEIWLNDKELFGIKVRVFSDVFMIASGRETTSDWFGSPRPNYLVVETDGSYALLDSLKTIGYESEKIRNYSASLMDTSLNEALVLSDQILRELGAFNLPNDCLLCEWRDICKGGYLVSRYSREKNFNNASVYCAGIKKIFKYATSMIDGKDC
jgi:uncharacterized protein